MSEQDIQVVKIILKGILNPDNKQRKEATDKLEEIRKNTPGLLFCLISILSTSSDKTEKTVSAVLIRKILEIKDDQIYSPHWKALDENSKGIMKKLSLEALIKEEDRSLIGKINECVIQIAMNAFNEASSDVIGEVWPDVINYSVHLISTLEVNQSNYIKIESGLRLFEGIFGFIYEILLKTVKLQQILERMTVFMKCDNLQIASKSVKTISEMSFYASKKEIKAYKDIIFPILEVTLKCFSSNNENELKTCCKAIIEMSTENTGLLFKNVFSDLFILMGKISEKNDYDDDNIKGLAFEVVVNLVEFKESLFTKDIPKTKLFIEALIKYALTMDNEINDEWRNPSQLSYFDIETIYEKELSSALGYIERVLDIVDEQLLPIISQYISDLLGNTSDWRFKYVGILLFKTLIGKCEDMVTVDNLFPIIFEHVNHENEKIRYAALNTIEEIEDHFQPYFSEKYSSQLLPFILSKFNDPILKVQLEATEVLSTMITTTGENVIIQHIQSILDAIFNIFLRENIPNNLRECLLNVVASLVSQLQEKIGGFASKCFSLLCEFFNISYTNQINKPLYGNLIECITLLGPFDKETYLKIVPSLVHAIVKIQESTQMSTDPIRPYIQDSLPRLVYILKTDFKDLIPLIIESTMKLITTIPEMSLVANEETFKVDDILSSVQNDPSEVKIKMETIKTSSTEEMASSIETLNKIIESLGDLFLPYIERTNKEIFNYLVYIKNEDIRQFSSDTLPIILSIIRKYSTPEALVFYSKLYTTELMQAIQCEFDNETLGYFLENLKEIIQTGNGFLIKDEVNSLFQRILTVFDDVEQRRIKLMEKKGSLEERIVPKARKSKENDEDEDSEDEDVKLEKELKEEIENIEDIQSEMTDLIGKLFSTHKAYSEDVINVVLTSMIPKYFREGASAFEIKMGIYLVDDIIEFLGQDCMPENLWHEMAKMLIKYGNNDECSLRQASLYGIGIFSRETKRGFDKYANECLDCIYKGLSISSENKDETSWGLARDNGVASLGKIIKFQAGFIDVKYNCEKWLGMLPILEDEEEMMDQHELLCDIILNKAEIIFGDNLVNGPKVFILLGRIFNSKFSNEAINLKIKQIMVKVKNEQGLVNMLNSIYETSNDEKVKKRIKKLIDG